MIACRRAMAAVGREVPLQVQVTMELTGRMLPGTEISAALCALDAMQPDVIGINCATGPVEMSEHLRHLAQHARMPISCIPNAGLPSVVDGHMHYDLTPDALAEHHRSLHHRPRRRDRRRLLRHHAGAPQGRRRRLPRPRARRPATPEHEAGATSIYSMVPFHQDTSFLIIGERTNANGSKKFREALLEADWDTTVAMAKDQVKEGSHVLDVCVDYVGRDGTARHGRGRVALRHPVQRAAGARLDRAPGHGGRPAVARRPGHPQLGQPRGRRGRRLPPRPGLEAGPRVRRRRDLPAHRRGGPGPRRRVEAAGRPSHPRPGRRPLRPRARRHHLRRPDLPALHRRRRPARRRHGHPRGHHPHQGRAARRAHHARACPTSRSASSRPPATCSTRCSCTRRWPPGSTRPSCTRPASCRSTRSPRSSARSPSTSSTTAAARPRATSRPTTRCRPCWRCSRTSTRPRWSSRTAPTGPSSSGSRSASSTATATASRPTSTRPWPRASRPWPSSTTSCWPA